MDNKNYFPGFDCLKLLLSFLIVSIHVGPFLSYSRPLDFLVNQSIARFGVPVFYMISAFLLMNKAEGKLSLSDESTAKKQIKRLLLLYLIWTLIYTPVWIAEALKSPEIRGGIRDCAIQYIKDVIFIGLYRLWYIHSLIIGLVIVITIRRCCSKYKAIIVCVELYVIGILFTSYRGLVELLMEQSATLYMIDKIYRGVFATTRNGFFFAPLFLMIGCIVAENEVAWLKRTCLLTFAIGTISLVVEVYLLHKFEIADDYSLTATLPIGAVALFMLAKEIKNIRMTKDTLSNIRNLSILVYLIHPLIIVFLGFVNVVSGVSANSLIVYMTVLIISVVLSEMIILLSNKLPILHKLY